MCRRPPEIKEDGEARRSEQGRVKPLTLELRRGPKIL
jgi:hypothetical protein